MPGPKFVICYICGRKYGTQSITIHEKTCLEKFRRDNDALPPNMRRAEPKRPQAMQGVLVEQTVMGVGQRAAGGPAMDYEKINQEAFSSFQGTLVPCQNCGRTFMPDRLEIHQRACNSLGGQTFRKGAHKPGKPQYQVRLHKRPPGTVEAEAAAREAAFDETSKEQGAFVTCKMCGKAFMGHSLKIHQAQCVKKGEVSSTAGGRAGGGRSAGRAAGPSSGPSGGPRAPRPGPSNAGGGYANMAGRQGADSEPFGGGGRPPPRGGRGGPAAGPSGFGSSRTRELAGGYANMSGR